MTIDKLLAKCRMNRAFPFPVATVTVDAYRSAVAAPQNGVLSAHRVIAYDARCAAGTGNAGFMGLDTDGRIVATHPVRP